MCIRDSSEAEGIDVEDKALTYIAKVADGSMRDALSLLDQCVAFHFGERLDVYKRQNWFCCRTAGIG